jgi:cytochrome P450
MIEYFNPHDNDWLKRKFEIYKELRNRDTAYYSEKYKMHVITRHQDVKFILERPEIFSSANGNLIVEKPHRFGQTLGASDNPVHNYYKNIVINAYSKDNINRISDVIRSKIRTVLKEKKETFNISAVIEYISACITATILNLPGDQDEIVNMIMHIQRHAGGCVLENIDNTEYINFRQFLLHSIKNNMPAPGPGLYAEYMKNANLSADIINSLFTGPCISGASSMSGGLQFLILDLCRENQLDVLLSDMSLIPNAINESLRFNASTGRFSRTVMNDVMLHGVHLKPNDRVALCLDSANRDEERFTNPDVFDLHRSTKESLAFGYGVHACIALVISKAMMKLFLEEFLLAIGKYTLTTKNEDLTYVMTQSGNDDMISNIHIKSLND